MLKTLTAALMTLFIAVAAQAEDFAEGTHYKTLASPVRTADQSRIEVSEVFWYGCIHCFHFDPLLEEWKKTLGSDVDFHRSPAMWNQLMAVHAQAFYAAESLGVLDTIHEPLFKALNVERRKLATEDQLADFFAEHGVAKDDFLKAFNSFGVKSKVKQADARARGYQITGTPALVVEGKYLITAKGGFDEVLKVADFLIAKERAERAR